LAENIAIVVMARSLPGWAPDAIVTGRHAGVHRAETMPEHSVSMFHDMASHTSMTSDRPPMKPTPVKSTPIKLTPPRQTPVKPERT
jgi:hypothetical protein